MEASEYSASLKWDLFLQYLSLIYVQGNMQLQEKTYLRLQNTYWCLIAGEVIQEKLFKIKDSIFKLLWALDNLNICWIKYNWKQMLSRDWTFVHLSFWFLVKMQLYFLIFQVVFFLLLLFFFPHHFQSALQNPTHSYKPKVDSTKSWLLNNDLALIKHFKKSFQNFSVSTS